MKDIVADPNSPSSVLDAVARDILVCPCHEGAGREFSELPEFAQDEVWSDLTGKEVHLPGNDANSMPEEPPEMVEEALNALNEELAKRFDPNPQSTDGLSIAVAKYPNYVNDPRFRLKFLRAERFDPNLAAERMAIHFECKLAIWGEERLGREITLQDMEENDLHSLGLGYFQILPELDHAGRRVFFYYKALTDCYRERMNIIRAVWYLTNLISEDESVQKLGIVNVVYNVGGFPEKGMDYEKSRRLSRVFRGIPVRFDSFIVCLDDSPWLNVVEAFSFMVNKFIRVRMRTVLGSHTECLYKLMALGVPYFSLPVTHSSTLTIEEHARLLERLGIDGIALVPQGKSHVAVVEDESMHEDPLPGDDDHYNAIG